MKPISSLVLAAPKLFIRIREKFLLWEKNLLKDYPEDPSYERRVGRHLLHLTLVIAIIALVNRIIHPLEGDILQDLIWEVLLSMLWIGNIYLIRKKQILLIIFLYFLYATIVFFIHYILKDLHATDLTYVHPYHVFEVAITILILCTFVSFKFASKRWVFFMTTYASVMLGLHGYAISQHYPATQVMTLTAIAIFSVCVGLIALHFTAEFLHKQRKTIEVQQKEIQQKNKELGRRLTDLRNFTYIASHDLKSPLRTVISFQDLLKRRLSSSGDSDSLAYLEYAHQGAHTLNSILEDLLDFTQLTAHTPEEAFEKVDISGIVHDIKRETAASHSGFHEIHVQDSLPEVYAVKSYMKIVLQNLIHNGIKYNEEQVPQVTILGKQEGDQVMISVVDNGIGIQEEYLEKIFVPFERLHSEDEYEGTGFGLAITKHLVEKLHGEIEVVSEPGVGSVFTAVLQAQQ